MHALRSTTVLPLIAVLITACETYPGPVGLDRRSPRFLTDLEDQAEFSDWSAPVNLGLPVNTGFAEFQPDLSHDGRTLLFIAGVGRGGLGGFDIWMSTRTVSGH